MLSAEGEGRTQHSALSTQHSCERWLVLLLLLLAAFFRLHRLDDLPPGMFDDIGVNGLDVLDVLAGRLALFFPRNFGREPLFIYLQAALVAVAGPSPFVMNFAGVAVGLPAVALSYRLFRELFGWRVALFAALLLAVSFWFVALNRVGLRATSAPLALLLTLFFLWRCLRDGRRRDAVLGGVALGASIYTYIAARMLPLLVVVLCLAEWPAARRRWRDLALLGAVALLVAAPELAYFARYRDELAGRAWDVSVFNPAPEIEGERNTPLQALRNTAGMFFLAGDRNARHNVPGRPVFDPAQAALFLAGLGLALRRAPASGAYRWPLLWLVVMSLPSALSHESPTYFRTLAAAPAAFLFPGLVLGELTRWRSGWLLAAAVVAVGAATTYRLYFDEWGLQPTTYWAYDGNLPRVARFVEARPEPRAYMSIDRRATILFLAPRSRQAGWYREESAAVPVPAQPTGDVLYVSARYAALKDRAAELLPGLERLPSTLDPHGGDDFVAYRWPAEAVERFLAERRAAAADMPPDFRLIGYALAERELRLFWQPLAAKGPYDLYVHLLDGAGRQVVQSDVLAWPIDAGPPHDDLIVTRHQLAAGPGAYVAEVGVVHRSVADRAQLVGGPVGEVARIPVVLP
ncbi:MAG TPA: glycosyltransferase family 39 protein [Chloroflexota bacterium]|nr:glycosyltransferase family 39 protein [Chloroflexota bacterium]